MQPAVSPAQQAPVQAGLPNPKAAQQQQGVPQPASPKKPTKKRIRIQTEKRKEQNRSNQRAFRQRRERYVKDLEISHHNLRHLVNHQGGEIESLRARLVDLSGGKEGNDIPTRPKLPLALSDPRFGERSDSGSTCSDDGAVSPQSSFDDGLRRPSLDTSPMLPSEGTLAAQPPAMHVTSASLPDRSSVAMPPTSASARSNMAACAPPAIAPTLPGAIPVSDAARQDAQQFWTASSSAPARTSPPRTISTGSSSIASSLGSSIYTPSTPASSTFDGAYQVQQPFLAVDSAPTESYNTWQPETPGHLSDFSQWLQQSMQSSQACLASQEQTECPPGLGMSLDSEPASSFSYSSHWQSHNALGLENLFPSLGPGSTRMTLDPLQLLGRPLTPLYRLSSPSAEYTFAN